MTQNETERFEELIRRALSEGSRMSQAEKVEYSELSDKWTEANRDYDSHWKE